jgi:putative two-component system response regulator
MEIRQRVGGRILIIEPKGANTCDVEALLTAEGYQQLIRVVEPWQSILAIEAYDPDLILFGMPTNFTDGMRLLAQFCRETRGGMLLPIIVITSETAISKRRQMLDLGVRDVLVAPLDPLATLTRIGNVLDLRLLSQTYHTQTERLEKQMRERTWALEAAHLEILERLARAAEFRDDQTGQHTRRVGKLSALIAAHIGLSPEDAHLIKRAAPLHDIGKIAVPDHILLKGGPLTEGERSHMQTHTTIGARMLAGGRFVLLQIAEAIAYTHHERWDGSGYPLGLKGENISLTGRIVTAADVFDALTHARSYKPAWPVQQALDEMNRQSGRQFDPQVIAALLHVVERGMHLDGATSNA